MATRRLVVLGCLLLSHPARALDPVAELIGQLARERSYAEQGAGLLKRWVKKPSAILQGQRLYADAKAASDEAIAYLAATLARGHDPGDDPGLRTKLATAAERRLAFSRHADASLDALAGKKNPVADALGKAAGDIVTELVTAAIDVWKTLRTTNETRRDTLRHQVEAERWKSFGAVLEA